MTRLRRSREAGALVVRGMVVVPKKSYAKGRFARMRYSSVLSTCFILARWRLRLRFLLPARWRRPDWDARILPVAVILKRLATAFLVLRRAVDLGIRLFVAVQSRRRFCGSRDRRGIVRFLLLSRFILMGELA